MVGPQRREGLGHGPRLERAVRVVVRGQRLERFLPGLRGPGLTRPVSVNRQVAGHGEQPGTRRTVHKGLRVSPGPHDGLLHKVLRLLPVSASQVQGVPKQRSAVFGVQRPYKGIVGHALTTGRCCARHTSKNVRFGRLVQWRRGFSLPGRTGVGAHSHRYTGLK